MGVLEFNDGKLAVISGLTLTADIWISETGFTQGASAGNASYTVGFSSAKDCAQSGESMFMRAVFDLSFFDEPAPNVDRLLVNFYGLNFSAIGACSGPVGATFSA